MKYFTLILVLFTGFSTAAMAGGDHEHNPDGSHKISSKINKDTALDYSRKVIADLIKRGKLDQSWKNASLKTVSTKVYKKKPEWVVTYANIAEKDASKSTLYVFLSQYGDYLGANFTGE